MVVDSVDGCDEEECVGFGVVDEHEKKLQRRLHHESILKQSKHNRRSITALLLLLRKARNYNANTSRRGRFFHSNQ